MRAHQMTYGFIAGDAISNHIIEINARLRSWGYETNIYAQHIAPEMADRARPDWEFAPYISAKDDLLLYHYSIYSPNIHLFRATRGRRIVIYHNITPSYFFRGWDANLEMQCAVGRLALTSLVDCDLALGDSDFNRRELVDAGFPVEKTGVLPIFLPPCQSDFRPVSNIKVEESRCIAARSMVNWLTVGRVVPSKGIDEAIRLFNVYHRFINPLSCFYIVGSCYIDSYIKQLKILVNDLGLTDHVTFTGRVSDEEVVRYYQMADLYIVTSYHEGFCVPLVESMCFGIPILARKSTAIPETLGGAGVLFTELDYKQVAEMAHLLVTDKALRCQIIRRQKERLLELGPAHAEVALKHALNSLGLPT